MALFFFGVNMDYSEQYRDFKKILWNKSRKVHHELSSYEQYYTEKDTALIFKITQVVSRRLRIHIPNEIINNATLILNHLSSELQKLPNEEKIKWELI